MRPLETLRTFANDAWARSLPEIERWMRSDLVPSFVYGGHGITGIQQTDFYKFISSAEGLSELGIEATEPPKLLEAYTTTAFRVTTSNKVLTLEFGDYAKLKMATQHPANGTGHLHIDSWLEWVDGLEVNRGFVPRSKITDKSTKSIRLGSPLGGLMLPRGAYGSTGLWRFPQVLRDYEDKWFAANVSKINDLLIDKTFEIFATKLIS